LDSLRRFSPPRGSAKGILGKVIGFAMSMKEDRIPFFAKDCLILKASLRSTSKLGQGGLRFCIKGTLRILWVLGVIS